MAKNWLRNLFGLDGHIQSVVVENTERANVLKAEARGELKAIARELKEKTVIHKKEVDKIVRRIDTISYQIAKATGALK